MKTKIGTEVAHVTRDSDTTFKAKRSKVKVTGGEGLLWRPPAQLVLQSEMLSDGHVCQFRVNFPSWTPFV